LSRTDSHVPLYVRLARRDLTCRETHDHRTGKPCDLPADPQAARTRCSWEFVYTGTAICPCELCHAGAHRRRANRNARHADRVRLHLAKRSFAAGDYAAFDSDVASEPSSFW
jgi:hypothetical protein